MVRRLSAPNVWRIEHLLDRITLVQADLLDQLSLIKAVEQAEPTGVLQPRGDVVRAFILGSADADRGIQLTGRHACPRSHSPREAGDQLYQASSSEMYGRVREVPQTEKTPFYPRSPYGVSKVFGHYITVNYRESYGIFAVSGILFNHESPRRGLEFVTRKVTRWCGADQAGADRLAGARQPRCVPRLGLRRRLRARDVADAAAGRPPTITWSPPARRIRSSSSSKSPSRMSAWTGRSTCVTDPRFLRPAEVDHLIGDPTKARTHLKWEPSVDFPTLVRMMVDADIERLKSGRALG